MMSMTIGKKMSAGFAIVLVLTVTIGGVSLWSIGRLKDARDELRGRTNDMAVAAKSAIYMRKVALEKLVALMLAEYFAGPNAPRDIDNEWERRQRKGRHTETRKAAKKRSRSRK